MAKHILSKSTFIKGSQCHKQLYLQKKQAYLRDKMPPERLARFKRGHQVGEWIYKLFPGGENLAPKSHFHYAKAVAATKKAIESGVTTLYEAAFQYDDVLILLDVLHKKDGKWFAYEVKSSKAISDVFVKDASIQNYVIEGCGLVLEDFLLVNVNTNYLYEGEINYSEYFVFTSVHKEVNENLAGIKAEVQALKQMLLSEKTPDIEVGKHCFSPYECDFIGHCWATIPEQNVFLLHQANLEEKQTLFDAGIKKLAEIENPKTELQKMQIKAAKSNRPVIRKRLMSQFFEQLGDDYELFCLLSFAHAQPIIEGTKPFQKIPIAYESKDSFFEVFSEEDDMESFIQHLKSYIQKGEKLLVYDKSSFLDVLKEWGIEFEPNEVGQEKVYGITDLFLSGAYYYPLFKGDISLKNISKIMFGDNSILSDELLNYELFDNFSQAQKIEKILKSQIEVMDKILLYFVGLK